MLVIDIEASGLHPQKHSIVSIGAIDFSRPERQFYGECRIWSGAHIMEDALAVNGFTEAEITDPNKMTEGELVTQFMEWTQEVADRTLTGQNVSFDRVLLQAAVERAGIMFNLPYRTLDTHTMCYMHMVKAGVTPPFDEQHRRTALNLNAVLHYCGIPNEPDPHNALTGAKCHAEAASRLLFSKKLIPEFASLSIPWVT